MLIKSVLATLVIFGLALKVVKGRIKRLEQESADLVHRQSIRPWMSDIDYMREREQYRLDLETHHDSEKSIQLIITLTIVLHLLLNG